MASGRDYDLYLEGISTDSWLNATMERQLYFSIYDKEGDGYTIYRMQYDEEWGYLCAGVLSVYYGDEGESQDKKDEKYQETFYEDGILA